VPSKITIIGVDGGATEVKARQVLCDNIESPTSFELGSVAASRTYEPVAGFVPIPTAEQLAQRQTPSTMIGQSEKMQGELWVQAAGDCIVEVAEALSTGSRPEVLVGMGMPGLKTPGGRGIAVLNNGPRIPDYLDRLEDRLHGRGVQLISPVAALGSDADYCGLGEEHAAEGLFRDVDSAYYVGCGTGIADALKLQGRLVAFDQARSWMLKSWQICSREGPTFEKLVSAKSINDAYAGLAGTPPTAGGYPEKQALEGQPSAVAVMSRAAQILAELMFERLDTIKNGRADAPYRGPAYTDLSREHPYAGTLVDRLIVGQRLGQIYGNADYKKVFGDKLEEALALEIIQSDDPELAAHYLQDQCLRPGVLRASRLRAAPALGAAVAAVQALRRDRPGRTTP
jgi:predicted NBD/HSP70 family sugar kinase